MTRSSDSSARVAEAPAPLGFKAVYARITKDPAEPSVLSDILGLVGYAASPDSIATWPLCQRVQAEAHAVNEHLRANDNILRRHPRPGWMPDPWQGPESGAGLFAGPSGTPLNAELGK